MLSIWLSISGPAICWCFLYNSNDLCLSESLFCSFPVDDIPDGTEIFGFAVLVLEVVLYMVSKLVLEGRWPDLPHAPTHRYPAEA